MRILYYPGCTIKRNAIEYEKSSLTILKELGIEVIELDKWYCCGTVFSLATDDLMKHLGAVRTLIKAQEQSRESNTNTLLTLCPMCFNVLKRVNNVITSEPDKLETISKFMDEEEQYKGGIEIVHIVEILKEHIPEIKKRIVKTLKPFRIATYYGCTALRPKEIAIDNPEDPRIMDQLLEMLGAEIIDYPFKSECCGSYAVLVDRDAVITKCRDLLIEAYDRGANLMITICPLCHYNLKLTLRSIRRPPNIDVVYVTELLAYSMGFEDVISSDSKSLLDKIVTTKNT
ncbi:MAG: heterodisulfide reductase, subunit B [Thermoprotei archaeon]|nr:MAG: heterodisulfide reductase, subunit B [Thermoprotei archaeon]